MFYETTEPNITTDHLVYHNDAFNETYNLWKTEKKGFLSTFPFGAFAYARLDDRLAHEPLWQQHQQQDNGTGPGNEKRDPMNLLPSKQPNIELFTTECYGGPKQYDQFPANPNKHVFSIIAELFSPRSRGSVTLSSKDAGENPVVDCNYLDHPLDMLVLSEGSRFANEIVMKGAGTKGIVKGSYPEGLGYGIEKNGVMGMAKREEWVPYVKEHATTCEFSSCLGSGNIWLTIQVTTPPGLVLWGMTITLTQFWIISCACEVLQTFAWRTVVSCLLYMEGIPRCLPMASERSARI